MMKSYWASADQRPDDRATLLFILKAPVVGSVKTRLAEHIGEVRALAAYRSMVEHLFDHLAAHRSFEIHFTPAEEEDLMRSWLGLDHPYYPQVEGDLGARMRAAVGGSFARGSSSVVLLGGDCPYVTDLTIREVETQLRKNDVVVGPAADGGYYLLSLNRPHAELFADIAWSTDTVFSTTLERIKAAGLRVAMLDVLEDVDDLSRLARAESYMGTRIALAE